MVTADALLGLAKTAGPCVSIHLPTHLFGDDYAQGPTRLGNLLDEASQRLAESGYADADTLLRPLRDLAGNAVFWQHQAAGLALFAAPSATATYRLAVPVAESLVVDDTFRLAQVARLIGGDTGFYVLALSRNHVRLYAANRQRLVEEDLGGLRDDIDNALAHVHRERQVQQHSTGHGTAQLHGHGSGGEVEKADTARFLKAVADAVTPMLVRRGSPLLVLACVDYYAPMFRSLSDYPRILDAHVEGSPDQLSATELHAAALPLVAPRLTALAEDRGARYADLVGTGRTSADVDEIWEHAREGRVETLFVGPLDGLYDEHVDAAIAGTLRTGGTVLAAPPLVAADPLAALLRY